MNHDAQKPTLDPQQQRAMSLLFEGHTQTKIAEELGIDRTTLRRWMTLPAWKAQYATWLEEVTTELRTNSINSKIYRAQKRSDRYDAHETVITTRRKRFQADDEPEYVSGYYKKVKVTTVTKDGAVTTIEKPEYDRDIVQAMQADEAAAAREFDPPVQKHEHSGVNGAPISMQVDINLIGFIHGGMRDGMKIMVELLAAGRAPTTSEEVQALLKEFDDRRIASAQGKIVPPWSEPYILSQ